MSCKIISVCGKCTAKSGSDLRDARIFFSGFDPISRKIINPETNNVGELEVIPREEYDQVGK